MSTISRLESKYSDILDRVHRRKEKNREKDDRDKTLEPLDGRGAINALAKSATSAILSSHHPKERTPFQLSSHPSSSTNKTGKTKYDTYDIDYSLGAGTSGGSSSITSSSKRSELGLLSDNTSARLKKEQEINKYHDYFSSPYSKLKSNDSGYYDGVRAGKENNNNNYKSKYEDVDVAGKSSRNRPLKTYTRNDSGSGKKNTVINLFDIDVDDRSRKADRAHRNYGHRRRPIEVIPKSKTQQFFESEDAFSPVPDEEATDRENKRKEIQGLIMKYAQLDDFYSKTTAIPRETRDHRPSPEDPIHKSTNEITTTTKYDINNNTYHDLFDVKTPEYFPTNLHKSQTTANVSRQMKIMQSPIATHQMQTAIVPITMPGEAYHRYRKQPTKPKQQFSTFVR